MSKEYDVVIVGGGTGGYVAAIRASQLGLSTAIVEKNKLGGTCLHAGCIPSKALLKSAEVFQTAKHSEDYGILSTQVELDFSKVQQRKEQIVEKLYSGVQYLMNKGKIDVYEGTGRMLGPSIFSPMAGSISVEFTNGDENEVLIPKNVILATGSRPNTLPNLEVDGEKVITSDEALKMENLPTSIIIVGGGVIGVEWASMLCDFGVSVTIVEYSERILPTEDEDVSKEMHRALVSRGVEIVTGAEVLPETLQKEAEVVIEAQTSNGKQTFKGEKLLLSVGRKANTEGIGIENTSIELDRGFIMTNEYYQTKESHIYAIGDVIGGLQLAHVASHEGIKAVEHIAGRTPILMRSTDIPRCIYSSPQAASVGLTEEEAIDNGFQVKVGKFPFQAVGKALISGEESGFAKIIADKETDDLLGVHLIGPNVTELISEAGLAKVLDATPWEMAHAVHPHPSLSEVLGEAALSVDGKAIHF
ncbi:dihydrolipoyl dehydrogenase [Priestia filamentosa]|uniref:Dihydrolipoyl dehydrogenase n=1 Tax=Priestia filamentosa TaxID=1402861 RepID=A0A1X7D0L6_9BACI|nr:dihydrolipoyl dehydrogenase [Priestia filamentosa]AKO94072.1 dihydrolipoyl dehydrogenase [Priestia filamentosa]MDT3764330.1 dihydrolipoyl dehydrogenase [Priestia filamentosa]OXS71209.1 dihydrolipoyl dehydrogenase [Priestia filamentosa]WCM14953.1 dihydrolipoyl dehydrogenase [Priestia filamentosa]SMF06440.1 dihydrolipoamide dehydrogenase [Priestia filamentosa]